MSHIHYFHKQKEICLKIQWLKKKKNTMAKIYREQLKMEVFPLYKHKF